jgi:hypothetical protein
MSGNDSSTNESNIVASFPVFGAGKFQGTGRFVHHQQDASYVTIIDFLEQINAPLYAFDALMKMLRDLTQSGQLDIKANHPSRQSFMNTIVKMFGDGVRPVKVDVPLETDAFLDGTFTRGCRDIASVFVFDAEEQIKSILNNIDLFQNIVNLVVDPDNPFGRYRSPDGKLGEVYSGQWYDRTYNHLIEDQPPPPPGQPRNFFLGLSLYVNKTGTSINQRHGLEPCMLTALIIKQTIRNQCYQCHRPMGYVPNLDQQSKAQKQAGKKAASNGRACRNYHACLGPILQSLERVTKNGFDSSQQLVQRGYMCTS